MRRSTTTSGDNSEDRPQQQQQQQLQPHRQQQQQRQQQLQGFGSPQGVELTDFRALDPPSVVPQNSLFDDLSQSADLRDVRARPPSTGAQRSLLDQFVDFPTQHARGSDTNFATNPQQINRPSQESQSDTGVPRVQPISRFIYGGSMPFTDEGGGSLMQDGRISQEGRDSGTPRGGRGGETPTQSAGLSRGEYFPVTPAASQESDDGHQKAIASGGLLTAARSSTDTAGTGESLERFFERSRFDLSVDSGQSQSQSQVLSQPLQIPGSISGNSADTPSDLGSDSGSVQEIFSDQVKKLNDILTSPHQGFRALQMTPTNLLGGDDEDDDDNLDTELRNLEISQHLLQEELAMANISILGETPAKTPTEGEDLQQKKAKAKLKRQSSPGDPSPVDWIRRITYGVKSSGKKSNNAASDSDASSTGGASASSRGRPPRTPFHRINLFSKRSRSGYVGMSPDQPSLSSPDQSSKKATETASNQRLTNVEDQENVSASILPMMPPVENVAGYEFLPSTSPEVADQGMPYYPIQTATTPTKEYKSTQTQHLYFSPTGGTKVAGEQLRPSEENIEEADLPFEESRSYIEHPFVADDSLVQTAGSLESFGDLDKIPSPEFLDSDTGDEGGEGEELIEFESDTRDERSLEEKKVDTNERFELSQSGSKDSVSDSRPSCGTDIFVYTGVCLVVSVVALVILLVIFITQGQKPDDKGGIDAGTGSNSMAGDNGPIVTNSRLPSSAPSIIPSLPSPVPNIPSSAPFFDSPEVAFSNNPTDSPTPKPSPRPTPPGAVVDAMFEITYDILIENGLIESIPSSTYTRDLIESMDLLVVDVWHSVRLRANQRRLQKTLVHLRAKQRRLKKNSVQLVLPTEIDSFTTIPCGNNADIEADRCEIVVASIFLKNGVKIWADFKTALVIAIETGRLQTYLSDVNPDSPVRILDSVPIIPSSDDSQSPTTLSPSLAPTLGPSPVPSRVPTHPPISINLPVPSGTPSNNPSDSPTVAPSNTPSDAPTSATSAAPTSAPSWKPTRIPSLSPSGVPTTSPTLSSASSLFEFLVRISFDGGNALMNENSPQYEAYLWLSTNEHLDEYSDRVLIQRYVMATLYYSTNGDGWTYSDDWLSEGEECDWFSKAGIRDPCHYGMLTNLELDYNNLGGFIPPELGLLSDSLERINLHGGPSIYLGGTIPTELGYLSRLDVLVLKNNELSGQIPTELGSWWYMRAINLSMNRLTGALPTEIGNLENLAQIDVKMNHLTGELPTEIGNLDSCRLMYIEDNMLSGPVPSEIGLLRKLQDLMAGLNMFTSVPSEMGRLSFIDTLSMYGNNIQGALPSDIGRLRRLKILELSDNSFTGLIPSELGRLDSVRDRIDLSHNRFSGNLPSEIGRLRGLRQLKLNHNKLTGAIPDTLGNLRRLTTIRLDSNDLNGGVPTEVCQTFNRTFPAFYADCDEFEDGCPCCTHCCVGESECTCRSLGTSREFLCFQARSIST